MNKIKKYDNKLIRRAIKQYKYDEVIDQDNELNSFMSRYNFSSDKKTLKKSGNSIWKILNGTPNVTHIAAKNLLYQGDTNCWKYFERTALFWTVSHINDPFIDHIKNEFEYSLFIERKDLIKILFDKSLEYLAQDAYTNNKEYIKQKVYPSTYFVHFLIEKWLGENPVLPIILKYGKGFGIYQPIIDNWENLSSLQSSYWDELCEYHLKGLSLFGGEKWENEEFLGSGLIPMELLNLIKVL